MVHAICGNRNVPLKHFYWPFHFLGEAPSALIKRDRKPKEDQTELSLWAQALSVLPIGTFYSGPRCVLLRIVSTRASLLGSNLLTSGLLDQQDFELFFVCV